MDNATSDFVRAGTHEEYGVSPSAATLSAVPLTIRVADCIDPPTGVPSASYQTMALNRLLAGSPPRLTIPPMPLRGPSSPARSERISLFPEA